jgi:ligand-binding SRPBCC domain-containing protein
MGKVYSLKSIQKIPASLEDVWNFFSDASNLISITPPFLNLAIKNELFGEQVYSGQIILYTVRPLLGIPLSWMTEITQVEHLNYFIDEQRKGPYKLWHHQHHFRAIEEGVEMTDLVHYGPPLGILGNIAQSLIIKSKLTEIFKYRYNKVNEIFGKWPHQHFHLEIT